MAIRVRRGLEKDFDPNKMLPGEWAVAIEEETSKQIVWMCFAPGVVKRMGTYEDFEEQIKEITADIKDEYLSEFQGILDQIEELAKETTENTATVIQIKSDITDTYLPKILEHMNAAASSASQAAASEANAAQSETNAKKSEEKAKEYAENAFSATPEGYEQLVENVEDLDIQTSTETVLLGTKAGGLKINSIDGNYEQDTTDGNNLLPYPYLETTCERNGVTWTDNGDGTVTANGESNGTIHALFNCRTRTESTDTALILPKGTYTVTGCPSSGSSTTYCIQIGKTENGAFSSLGYDVGEGATFTLTEETQIQIQLVVAKGYTAEDVVFKPMLRLAENTDDTWEPYTGGIASPNPDYPQDIKSVGDSGSVTIKTHGKNLIPYPYYISINTNKGITFTVNDDGTVVANGTSTADSATWMILMYQTTIPKGSYIISGCPSGGGSSTYRIRIEAGLSKTFVCHDTGNGATFTLTEDTLITIIIQVFAGVTVSNLTFKPMLRRAEVEDDTFEVYKETSITISLSEPLRAIGDVKDKIVKQDGIWGVERNVARVTLNSDNLNGVSLNNQYGNFASFTFSLPCKDSDDEVVVSTNMFIGVTANKRVINTNTYRAWGDNGSINIRETSENLLFTSEDAVKSFLDENEVVADYILATPTFEALPTDDQIALYSLETFDEATHLLTDSDVEPVIESQYGTSVVGATALKSSNDNDIGKVSVESGEAAVDFESEDSSNATAWTNVNLLQAGETLKSILGKISTMFRNIRWLKSEVDKKANVFIGYLTNTDLNYAITSENRAYRCDTTCTNLPVSGVGGLLEVFPNDEVEKITQRFTTDEGEIFTRYNTYPTLGVWSDWMASTGIMTLNAYLTSESDSGGEVALVSSSSIDIKSSVCIGFKYTTDEGIIYLNTIPTTSGKRIIPELKVEVISSNTYINVKPIDEDGAWPEIKAGTIELYLQRK